MYTYTYIYIYIYVHLSIYLSIFMYITLTFGLRVFAASETPAMRPAPPMGTTRKSASATCSIISIPRVPAPAMICRRRKNCAQLVCVYDTRFVV